MNKNTPLHDLTEGPWEIVVQAEGNEAPRIHIKTVRDIHPDYPGLKGHIATLGYAEYDIDWPELQTLCDQDWTNAREIVAMKNSQIGVLL